MASSLIYALHPSSAVTFSQHLPPPSDPYTRVPAHASSVKALTIDRFEGRYLLSGGADSSIRIWDLEASMTQTATGAAHLALSAAGKEKGGKGLGITQLAFYPFDSLAFLSSSYDHTVKLYSSETLVASAEFDLDAVVYNIALSPIASHLLVACATQHPNVRLVDLRSGATTHSLAGHVGAVLVTAWSPVRDHILVSAGVDGSVRFWDVRRSVGELGALDLEDSVGAGLIGHKTSPSASHASKSVPKQAHRGPVNGLTWTQDGRHVVSCGHDAQIRVWDTSTGANTLVKFGPMVRNSGLASRIPILAPTQYVQPHADVMFYPNGHEILAYQVFDGKLIRRLGRTDNYASNTNPLVQSKDAITSLAWRPHNVEMYSAHADGNIVAWTARTEEDAELDEEEEMEREESEGDRKRKRGVLEELYQGLTKRPIMFGNMEV
ncbi:WD40 repeat [Pyrenophora tritici-repentis]|uniref:DNA excision repair protein ERCC-8 n=2 Tax=Pyrenophora tritici-repentis TaxID=45151 RepID=A0A2W1GB58_9PLEO|nr:DNA excision repair protein ERCC-8 [Pyrenophora tritici-repentis Pt-1C-BFP]KAF7442684.1 DNA excision repair protein ERCC-8 [Pyrenophora tritici-repentis]EDU41773.1 DNA excision repair protein ERCC-8 [Pyrenophora tritici-repentis Pt-1C-BFP]KAI0583101.1 DNA excision repair protein ERCC-8 [Pyrenophora tritici-repentis]KAI1512812.1 DNA excision repair protein ERCC-8 [Pyrenophora tritici-repentis]KAI1544398.1 WD40 repeat [Pyrenophora tritici-repentis]